MPPTNFRTGEKLRMTELLASFMRDNKPQGRACDGATISFLPGTSTELAVSDYFRT